MYVYNYRVFDRYNRPVASLAVLADDDPNWRPTEYRSSVFGCESGIRFPTVKLLDFAEHEAVLEASSNPFAKVVLAHLKALETRDDPATGTLGNCGWCVACSSAASAAKDVRELFRVIDWLMELPPALHSVFRQEVDKIQEEKRMPYVTSIERASRCIGLRKGIEAVLRIRFGEEGLKLMPEMHKVYEEEKLEAILKALETASSPDAVRSLWSPENSHQ